MSTTFYMGIKDGFQSTHHRTGQADVLQCPLLCIVDFVTALRVASVTWRDNKATTVVAGPPDAWGQLTVPLPFEG